MPVDIGIVLTGTIIPNSTYVVHSDAGKRRLEYIAAINYYKEFAPVYFLENSTYPLLSDPEFNGIKGVSIRKLPMSQCYSRGKGYQEFEMINKWLQNETVLPKRFIKITGRYKILNFKDIFRECLAEKADGFLIDRVKKKLVAVTRLFCINTEFFMKYLMNIYLDCNDEQGNWVERVLYRKMSAEKICSRIFRHEPIFVGIDGSTGVIYPNRRVSLKRKIKRRVNYCLNKQYVIF